MMMMMIVKIKKWKKYPCIPEWMQQRQNDPFIYKLRSKQEIMRDYHVQQPQLVFDMETKLYPAKDDRIGWRNTDNRERIVKMHIDIRHFHFSDMQKDRFKYLVQNRLKGHIFKLVVKQYQTHQENVQRARQIIRQLYLQAKRAPDDNYRMRYNPYYRLRMKKKCGKTKEQRRKVIDEKIQVMRKRNQQYQRDGMTSEDKKRMEQQPVKYQDYEEMLTALREGKIREQNLQNLIMDEQLRATGQKGQYKAGEKVNGIDISSLSKERLFEMQKSKTEWNQQSRIKMFGDEDGEQQI